MTGTSRSWLCRRRALLMTALVAVAASASGQELPSPPGTEAGAHERLARMTLSLSQSRPYRFVLAYHGPITPFRGLLCYYFAGYNETCMDPRIEWLTPATEIELYAPGGVPRDLLEGYIMLVRYPSMSERVFHYRLADED